MVISELSGQAQTMGHATVLEGAQTHRAEFRRSCVKLGLPMDVLGDEAGNDASSAAGPEQRAS